MTMRAFAHDATARQHRLVRRRKLEATGPQSRLWRGLVAQAACPVCPGPCSGLKHVFRVFRILGKE